MTEEQQKRALELLREAHDVLKERWFVAGDDDEYNDDEVIDTDKAIEDFLEEIK